MTILKTSLTNIQSAREDIRSGLLAAQERAELLSELSSQLESKAKDQGRILVGAEIVNVRYKLCLQDSTLAHREEEIERVLSQLEMSLQEVSSQTVNLSHIQTLVFRPQDLVISAGSMHNVSADQIVIDPPGIVLCKQEVEIENKADMNEVERKLNKIQNFERKEVDENKTLSLEQDQKDEIRWIKPLELEVTLLTDVEIMEAGTPDR